MTKPKPPTLGQKLLEGLKEAVEHSEGKIELRNTTLESENIMSEPLIEMKYLTDGKFAYFIDSKTNLVEHLTEVHIYNELLAEKENVEILKQDKKELNQKCKEYSELYDELKSDLDKTKKALEDTNNGRPSEWAYTILRKERDELMVDAAKLVDALEHYCDIKCYCAACIGDPRAKTCNDLGRSEMRNAVKLWHSRNGGKVADKAVYPTNTIVCQDPYHLDTSISAQVYDICPSCKGK